MEDRGESHEKTREIGETARRSLGFWNSTVVRVKMSEYMCALAYKEAVRLLRGDLQPLDPSLDRPIGGSKGPKDEP